MSRRERRQNKIVGVDCREGPPVPIPNTEVKLAGAEDTWLVTARKQSPNRAAVFFACGGQDAHAPVWARSLDSKTGWEARVWAGDGSGGFLPCGGQDAHTPVWAWSFDSRAGWEARAWARGKREVFSPAAGKTRTRLFGRGVWIARLAGKPALRPEGSRRFSPPLSPFKNFFEKISKKGLHFPERCGMITKPSRETAKQNSWC